MSEVRVVRIDGELSINPSIENLKKSRFRYYGGCYQRFYRNGRRWNEKKFTEAEMLEAIKYAHEEIKVQIEAQERLAAKNSCISNLIKRILPRNTQRRNSWKVWKECYDKVYNVAKPLLAKKKDEKNFCSFYEEFLSQYSEERAESRTIC